MLCDGLGRVEGRAEVACQVQFLILIVIMPDRQVWVWGVLCRSWTEIRRKCNKFTKQEFFTSLFPSRYSKEEAIQRMEDMIQKGKDAEKRIPIVIFDETQMKYLKQINEAAFS